MSTTVNLQGVTKSFGEVTALDALDLQITGGEMFALVGPDGAGKTTLLRILAAVLRQDRGTAEVLGRRLPADRRDLKPRIGYLSQGFSLYGDLSVDENLAFFAEIYGMSGYSERREELLQFTRLAPFRRRLAGRLSGGMKKKLALACALIHRPELIILDEPTTGVDPVSRRDFWLLLGELLHEGLTIVVATPYLDEAERCGRVGLLDRGCFLSVGRPEEVKSLVEGRIYEVVTPSPRRARKALTAADFPGLLELQAQGDRLHLRLSDVPGESPETGETQGADTTREARRAENKMHTGETEMSRRAGEKNEAGRPDEAEETEERIRSFFTSAGIRIDSVRETLPTLENLFISRIREEHRR
jgi:ABC-2 type transport system ATP-binding protein